MATSSSNTSAFSKTHYDCKWGKIEILTGDNYPGWSTNSTMALIAADCIEIVKGTEVRPAAVAAGAGIDAAGPLKDWKERARRAIQILTNSIDSKLQDKVKAKAESMDPAGIWTELNKFNKTSDPVFVANQRTEFYAATFDPTKEKIRDFVNRLTSFQLQLASTNRQITDEDLLERVLASLPLSTEYQSTKHFILRLAPEDRTIDKAIIMLQSHDNLIKPSAANYAGRGGGNNPRGRGQPRGGGRSGYRGRGRGYRGHGRGGRGRAQSFRGRGNHFGGNEEDGGADESEDWSKLDSDQCAWCHRHGHHEWECETKKKARKRDREQKKTDSASIAAVNRASMARARVIEESSIYSTMPDHVPSVLTPDLTPASIDHTSAYYSAAVRALTGRSNAPERALISRTPMMPALDSGASQHFSGVQSDFPQLKRWSNPKKVITADGTEVDAIGHSTLHWRSESGVLTLKEVWYVPAFTGTRLVSIQQLNDDGISVLFDEGYAIGKQKEPHNNIVFMVPKSNTENLFLLDGEWDASHHSLNVGVTSSDVEPRGPSSTDISEQVNVEENKWDLLHRRMGHISYKSLARLVARTGMPMPKRVIPVGRAACEVCAAGKLKERLNKKTDSRVRRKGRRLHSDISGELPKTYRGFKYFLMVTDDATRCCWIRLLKDKSAREIQPKIQEIVQIVKKETGEEVAYFRCDNGSGEFGADFKEWLRPQGIRHEPSPPYKHSLNGVVERAIQTMDNIARSMIFEAKLPLIFWDYAVEHATYLKNRAPTEALPWKIQGTKTSPAYPGAITPYEAMHGVNAKYMQLSTFGCAAYPKVLADTPGKFTPHTREEHVFIGMRGNSIYKLLNCRTLKVIECADAVFHEYKYPSIMVPYKFKDVTEELPTADDAPEEAAPPLIILGTPESSPEPELNDSQEKDDAETRSKVDEIDAETSSKIGAETSPSTQNAQQEAEKSADPPSSSRRSGRKIKKTVPFQAKSAQHAGSTTKWRAFSTSVIQSVNALNAVHLAEGKSSSLGVPSVLFENLTVEEAMLEDAPAWTESILKELRGLQKTGTYEIIRGNPPSSRKIISSKWVLKNKFNKRGEVKRRKSRIVARGFEQTYGIDYFETFASVMRYTTLRVLLALARDRNLEIDQIDIDSAFLNPPLKEEVYMEIPEFFTLMHPELEGQPAYLRLLKSLYGLKQAPRAWLDEVKQFFLEVLHLKQSEADPNLFIGPEIWILLFVDDMLIIGPKPAVDTMKAKILGRWDGQDLSPAELFVGFQIERDRTNRTLLIHQEMYTNKLLERMGMANSNPTLLPFPAGTVLRDGNPSEALDDDEVVLYMQIVGSVIYLSNCTRPDISYQVGQLARFMSKPCTTHLQLAKRLLRYLNGTRRMGILYQGSSNEGYDIYADATWATENDRISFQGWVVILMLGAVAWAAQRQHSTALSSMDSEIMAANEAAKEAAWIEKLWKEVVETPLALPPILHCDNLSAIDFTQDAKFTNKSKHIEVRFFYIRNDMVARGRLRVEHIPGTEQVADILTKQVAVPAYKKHKITMGLTTDWDDRDEPRD